MILKYGTVAGIITAIAIAIIEIAGGYEEPINYFLYAIGYILLIVAWILNAHGYRKYTELLLASLKKPRRRG